MIKVRIDGSGKIAGFVSGNVEGVATLDDLRRRRFKIEGEVVPWGDGLTMVYTLRSPRRSTANVYTAS